MERKKRENLIISKLAVTAFLSATLLCIPSFAETDFSYIEIGAAKPIKLINPLYLDTSRTVKPVVKIETPYTPEINDSDYFSSEITEEEIQNYPEPEPEISEEEKLVPINDMFTPPHENNIAEEELKDNIPEAAYYASVQDEELNLEGKIINNITFEGLKVINEENILKQIKTQTGSIFNENLLQLDLQKIYSIGFFTDNMSIEPQLNKDGSVDLKFILEENIPVTEISVIGNTVISSMELLPFITPLKNMPQNIEKINEAIEKINTYYHDKGFILAGVNSVDDRDDGNLIFSINEGIIDKVIIEGNEKTKDYVIERNIMTRPGTVYNENYLKDDISRIYSTKIFKEVNREISPSETTEGEYSVKVVVSENSPNELSAGGGIDTGLGLFGSLAYNEFNLGGRGQKLSLSGILGSGILMSDSSIKNKMNYQLELSFFEPYFLNADNSLASKIYFREFGSWQVPLAIERRFGINTGVEHKARWNKNVTTSFNTGYELIHLKEGDRNRISEMYALRNLNIADRAKELTGGSFFNFAPGIRYNSLDSQEIPRDGIIADAKFIEALSVSNFKNTNGRLAGGVTKFVPIKKKSSLAFTARGGIRLHGDELPEVMAFRLGGPYSIRGFRMSGVGTGDAFAMGSVELATPLPFVDRLKWEFFQKIRLTFFVDGGQAFNPTISSRLYDRPMGAITAGMGLKVYIPGIGPVSVDYGVPILNPGSYGRRAGYFTFGTGYMGPYGW